MVSEKCKAQQIEVYRSYHQKISYSIASVALQWYTQRTAIVQEIQGLGQTNLTYEKAKRMAVNSVRQIFFEETEVDQETPDDVQFSKNESKQFYMEEC